ncbi:MAG: hypothetical protein ACREIT_05405, partial [Tepidisphaeraceae bacterium]
MSHEHSHLSRFLRRVRVRLLVARVAECAGGCAAIGCGAALLLMPILMWRGQSAMPVAAAALAGGMLAGLIWGVIRRPTLFDAATE